MERVVGFEAKTSQLSSSSFLRQHSLYILSKGTPMEREIYSSNLNCSTFLLKFSALPRLCYPYPFLPLKCQLAYIYHVFATITLVYSIHDATEEVISKKMIESSQRERSIERNKDQMHEGT
jgi:hypothetical protein